MLGDHKTMKFLSKISSGSKRRKADQMILEALVKLDNDHNDQAQQLFGDAIKTGGPPITAHLSELFGGFVRQDRHREAVAIGHSLCTYGEAPATLMNELGNQYRKLNNLEDARELYRQAFTKDSKYAYPWLNLAAVEARVPWYDDQILPKIKPLFKKKALVLPEYQGTEDLLSLAVSEVLTQMEYPPDPDNLVLNQCIAGDAGAPVSLAKVVVYLVGRVKDRTQRLKNGKDPVLPSATDQIFNLVIYCLADQSIEAAEEAINQMATEPKPHKYLPLFQAKLKLLQDDSPGAINLLRSAQRSRPMDRFYNLNLGIALYGQKKFFLANMSFIKTAFLLESSVGYYDISKVAEMGVIKYEEGAYVAAKKLFDVALANEPEPSLWLWKGRCLVRLTQISSAGAAFKSGLALDNESTERLAPPFVAQLQGIYSQEAQRAMAVKKFELAHDFMVEALEFDRNVDVLELAAKAAYSAGDTFKSAGYREEINELKGLDHFQVAEETRQRYLSRGHEEVKNNNYQSAFHYYELAFEMKLDKGHFIRLAGLYKKLNQKRALSSLIRRYKWMQEKEGEQLYSK